MHLAICDDNVADRKQLERLLKRESDKRATTKGVLYVDSFGSPENMLAKCMLYDGFFFDMCINSTTCSQIIAELDRLGSIAPVVLCSSSINYKELTFPDRILHMDKPIRVSELTAVVDQLQAIKEASVPVIELREETETHYVTEPDILYAVEDGRNLVVTLKDSKKVYIVTTALNFFSQIEKHRTFFVPNHKTIVNGRYIVKFGFHKITLTDKTVFKVSGPIMEYAHYTFDHKDEL